MGSQYLYGKSDFMCQLGKGFLIFDLESVLPYGGRKAKNALCGVLLILQRIVWALICPNRGRQSIGTEQLNI